MKQGYGQFQKFKKPEDFSFLTRFADQCNKTNFSRVISEIIE
jgi:hypothetical protein